MYMLALQNSVYHQCVFKHNASFFSNLSWRIPMEDRYVNLKNEGMSKRKLNTETRRH